MESTSTNTRTSNPFGDLYYFPREIRDEIYRNIFPDWRVAYETSIIEPTGMRQTNLVRFRNGRCDWTPFNLSILRLSKAIKSEATPIFYSKGYFRFHYFLGEYFPEEAPQLPDLRFMNCIRNVEIICDVEEVDYNNSESVSDIYGSAPAGPLGLLQGANIPRNSIVVVVSLCSFGARYGAKLTESPLIKSLKEMIGFKTVTLRLKINGDGYCPPQGTSRAQIKKWTKAGEWEKVYGGFIPLFRAMRKELEPTLGICGMGKLERGERCGNLSLSGRRAILFHPRDHQAKISKANKDKMKLEQSMSTAGPT